MFVLPRGYLHMKDHHRRSVNFKVQEIQGSFNGLSVNQLLIRLGENLGERAWLDDVIINYMYEVCLCCLLYTGS